jgi:DeoR/GlpR family transcriptional regulator of sugar metabolism
MAALRNRLEAAHHHTLTAATALISPLTAVKHVITDDAMPTQARDWLESNGISVEVV